MLIKSVDQNKNDTECCIDQIEPVPKFIDPINYHLINGDFIVPDKFYKNINAVISPFLLISNQKFLRSIQQTSLGVSFIYEDLEKNRFSSIKLLSDRLKTLGEKDLYDFSLILDDFEKFNFNERSNSLQNNKKKIDLNSEIEKVYNLFPNSPCYIFGFEYYPTENILSHRLFSTNNSFLSFLTSDSSPNFLNINFQDFFKGSVCYLGIKDYMDTLKEFIVDMMYNYKSSNDQIKRTQTFKTFFGLKKIDIIVQKKPIPDSNVILITCFLQKCFQLENLEFEIQELKIKNSNQRVKEMKDIENNGKLLSLYSNLKKKIKN